MICPRRSLTTTSTFTRLLDPSRCPTPPDLRIDSRSVSIGFRAVLPEPPPLEAPLWRVQHKDGREARAIVTTMSHGRELRVFVGDDLRWSRLFPRHGGNEGLLDVSNTTRTAFEARPARRAADRWCSLSKSTPAAGVCPARRSCSNRHIAHPLTHE